MEFRIFDLTLESDIDLPELDLVSDASPQLWLTRDPDPSRSAAAIPFHALPDEGEESWLQISRLAAGFSLRFGGSLTVRYVSPHLFWSGGEELGAASVRHTILDQLLPLAAAHEGRTVLHAACVVRDGRALLLLARAGSGKSTLAAAFLRNGMTAAADDAASVVVSPTSVTVRPAYYGLRLWTDATAALGLAAGAEVADGCDKRRVPSAQPPQRSLPLAGVYVLRPAPRRAPALIRALSAREHLMSLVRNAYVLDIEDRARVAAHFGALSEVATRVPVRELDVPRDLSRLDEVCAVVMSDMMAVSS